MSLADLLGKDFLNSKNYQRAITHRSVSSSNNERLEYLGDSLLGFFIAEWLFKTFPSCPEGDLTRLRAHLVKKDTLAEIAREQDLGKYLVLGAGELKSGGVHRSSILADALEALIGAVYISKDIDAAREFVLTLFASKLNNMPSSDQLKDSKTRLQELLQSRGLELPVYKLKEKTGKSGQETFTILCEIENQPEEFIGIGTSRRKAEQAAAEQAYDFMSQQFGV